MFLNTEEWRHIDQQRIASTPVSDRCAKLQRIHHWERTGVRMKLLRLLLLSLAAIQTPFAIAQETPQPTGAAATNKTPDPAATLAYIHYAWETLTRSMTDCHSLVDIKVTANPILYMPADVPAPPEVSTLQDKCNVRSSRFRGASKSSAMCDPKNCPQRDCCIFPLLM